MTTIKFSWSLRILKYLGIGSSTKQLNTIDLRNHESLETLAIQWCKKIIGLENCTRLSSLTLVEFEERDHKKIAALKSILELRIKTLQSKL